MKLTIGVLAAILFLTVVHQKVGASDKAVRSRSVDWYSKRQTFASTSNVGREQTGDHGQAPGSNQPSGSGHPSSYGHPGGHGQSVNDSNKRVKLKAVRHPGGNGHPSSYGHPGGHGQYVNASNKRVKPKAVRHPGGDGHPSSYGHPGGHGQSVGASDISYNPKAGRDGSLVLKDIQMGGAFARYPQRPSGGSVGPSISNVDRGQTGGHGQVHGSKHPDGRGHPSSEHTFRI